MNENRQEIMRLRYIVGNYEEAMRKLADLVDEYDNLPDEASMMDSIDLLDAIVYELRDII